MAVYEQLAVLVQEAEAARMDLDTANESLGTAKAALAEAEAVVVEKRGIVTESQGVSGEKNQALVAKLEELRDATTAALAELSQ